MPDLAEETTVSDDKRTYTMKLRQDAKWTNGEPVTANDFVFAYQAVCNKETASSYAFIIYDNLLMVKKYMKEQKTLLNWV